MTTARGLLGRIEQRYRALRDPPKSTEPRPEPPAAPAAPRSVSWELRSQAELVDHIVGHYHAGLRRDLPLLIEAARAPGPSGPDGLSDLLETLASELENHMAKEERVLFPTLRTGQRGGSVDMPIRMMEREHEEHEDLVTRILELASAPTVPGKLREDLRALESALREHVYLENNVLFNRALGGAE